MGLVEADRRRVEAEQLRDIALANEKLAQQRELHAKASEAEMRAVLDYFQVSVLAAARPKGLPGGLGNNATIRAAVDAAEPKISAAFRNKPLVEASIRNALGLTYTYLEEAKLAISQFDRALDLRKKNLGPDHPDTLESASNLAEAYVKAGDLREATRLHEETLKLRLDKLGPDHPDTLTSMNNLAVAYHDAGRFDEALRLQEVALEMRRLRLGADHRETLSSMGNLGTLYISLGRFKEAEPLFTETVKRAKIKLGAGDSITVRAAVHLALVYKETGRTEDALRLYEEALAQFRGTLGPDHPDTLVTTTNLAQAYRATGRLEEALPLYEEVLKRCYAKRGTDHPETLLSEKLFFVAAGQARENRGLGDPLTEAYYVHLGDCLEAAGQARKAEPLWRELANFWKDQEHPGNQRHYTAHLASLGGNLLQQQKYAEAEAPLSVCLAIRQKEQPDHWTTFNAKSSLGGSLLGQMKFAEAEPLLLDGYEGMKQCAASIPTARMGWLCDAIERIVRLYEATGQNVKATEWRKKLDEQKGTAKRPQQ